MARPMEVTTPCRNTSHTRLCPNCVGNIVASLRNARGFRNVRLSREAFGIASVPLPCRPVNTPVRIGISVNKF